jgi:hypothetical protein
MRSSPCACALAVLYFSWVDLCARLAAPPAFQLVDRWAKRLADELDTDESPPPPRELLGAARQARALDEAVRALVEARGQDSYAAIVAINSTLCTRGHRLASALPPETRWIQTMGASDAATLDALFAELPEAPNVLRSIVADGDDGAELFRAASKFLEGSSKDAPLLVLLDAAALPPPALDAALLAAATFAPRGTEILLDGRVRPRGRNASPVWPPSGNVPRAPLQLGNAHFPTLKVIAEVAGRPLPRCRIFGSSATADAAVLLEVT